MSNYKNKEFHTISIQRWCRQTTKELVEVHILNKPDNCQKCNNKTNKIEGHHIDYTQPLLVNWLCRECHLFEHNRNIEFFKKHNNELILKDITEIKIYYKKMIYELNHTFNLIKR